MALPNETLETFLRHAGASGRLMGLDVGGKTIGLALSDTRRTVATPMQTLRRGKFMQDAATLHALIAEHEVRGLVIGLPLMGDGIEGKNCQSIRQFGRNMQKYCGEKPSPCPLPHMREGSPLIPILFWDERFSTSMVQQVLHEAEMSHRKRAEVVDKMAAGYILQGVLDRIRGAAPHPEM